LQIETVTVLEQKEKKVLGGDYRVLKFASEKIAPRVKPGQFIHLRAAGCDEIVLRRPFSVFKADKKSLAVLFKIIGKGTKVLSQLRAGDKASMIGPLGNGFPAPVKNIYPVFVAGGYGSAALYLLAERTKKTGTIFIGGKTKADILCADDFKRLGWNVRIATEDGSAGQKGLVTDILKEYLSEKGKRRQMALYACGPMGMLAAVAGIAMDGDWKAWLSLDKNMGCGVGACLACVQKIKVPGDRRASDSWKWARICTEGPVFECREIIWE
jgi:dihydroorotate dehydrogenase electron transfer subunit